MADITAKAYWKPAKRVKFMDDLPAGWVIASPETGKSLSKRRYPTEEEALADAPRVLAAYLARVKANTEHATERATTTEAAADAAPTGRPYTEVRNSLYGPGRVYHDQPGATQYDDGSGTYKVQIWDNS